LIEITRAAVKTALRVSKMASASGTTGSSDSSHDGTRSVESRDPVTTECSRSAPAPGIDHTRISVFQGDITRCHVDAIVTAANEALAGGGGVDGAVHSAAGPRLLEASRGIGHCPTGEAVVTPGFELPARWVIHAVGPIWRGGRSREPELLASTYRSILARAEEVGATSVAIPAISTGVYGFPSDLAAAIALTTLRETPTPVQDVILVAFDSRTADLYRDLLSENRANPTDSDPTP